MFRQRRNAATPYRPSLFLLEERLALGDGVLGLLAGASLPSTQAALPALVHSAPQRVSQADGVTRGTTAATQRLTFPTLADELLVSAFADAAPTTPPPTHRSPFHELFAPAAHSAARPNLFETVEPRAASLPAVAASGTSFATPRSSFTVDHNAAGDLLATLVAPQTPPVPTPTSVPPAQEAQVKENFGKLPLYFEQNVGQTDASVQFFTRGPGYGLYLTPTEAVMVLQTPSASSTLDPETGERSAAVSARSSERTSTPASDRLDAGRAAPDTTGINPVARQDAPPAVVRMQFVGANATPTVTGRAEQPGKINYFLGNDAAKWHTNIATFGQVHYDEVYPGIDLVYYGKQQQLEYDFVVSPGADPNAIRLNVSGAERLELDANGDLLMHAGGEQLRQHKPFVYQEVNGTRQEVASRFVLDGGQVRFDVAAYDAGRELVIDPVLSYSTYLGGSGDDLGQGIAVDSAGNAYLTGDTSSTNFPAANPFQPNLAGSRDAFVVKLGADGSTLAYASYLGGSDIDYGVGIAVDEVDNVYIAGHTSSTDFPTINALQPSFGGVRDGFVAKLRADGAALDYSTYLGGSASDIPQAITVTEAGVAYVAGGTASTNFPTVNAFQPNYGGGNLDAFVTQLRADGSALVYSTYLGGSLREVGAGIAVDSSGDLFLSGSTDSANFPTANALQPTLSGGTDAFVTRFRADGSALVYSTYLGGSIALLGSETCRGIAVDAAGNAFITGTTVSTDFPTLNALQPNLGGERDAFVAKLNPTGSALVFSTYLGGSGTDQSSSWDPIDVDADGNVLVMGTTSSTNFPTASPLQPINGGGEDAFVTKLRVDGSALEYSTYLGGSFSETGQGIAVDGAGNTWVTGNTRSANFPTVNPFQPNSGGGQDAFISRISSSTVASYYVYPDSGEVQAGVPFDLYVYALDADGNVLPDYTGEIAFFSTDKQATLPKPYTFQRTDQGVAYFPKGVTLVTPGVQELYVFDTATYEVFGYAAFEVQP